LLLFDAINGFWIATELQIVMKKILSVDIFIILELQIPIEKNFKNLWQKQISDPTQYYKFNNRNSK
jgi:hypothetical protein